MKIINARSTKDPVFNISNKNTETDKVLSIESETKRSQKISRVRRRMLKHIWLVRIVFLAMFVFVLYVILIGARMILIQTGTMQYLHLAQYFITAPESRIEMTDDKTSILLLGKGGVGHEAPDLTDTIIVVSIDHGTNSISTVALPRDIWIPELRAKLNSIYYWGNTKQENGGIALVKSVAETITGFPIHYGMVVDFAAFEAVIDELGGVEIEVENSFVDNRYPIKGLENDECGGDLKYSCRYETIEFTKGMQYMDSETALKYVRSRNAEGDEGTDFARAGRQQQVIKGIKEKVMSQEIILSPKRLRSLVDLLILYVETDIKSDTAAVMARRVFDSRDAIKSNTLPESFLINPPLVDQYDRLYVFVPNEVGSMDQSNPWSMVNLWFKCIHEDRENCENLIPLDSE